MDDPRELMMWNGNITPNAQEVSQHILKNKAPMRVFISRGNVRVPSIRSKRIRQLEARGGKAGCPHLLMIRPTRTATHKYTKRERLIIQDEAQQIYNLKYLKSAESQTIPNKLHRFNNIPPSAQTVLENLPPLTTQAANVPRTNERLLRTSNHNEMGNIINKQGAPYCEAIPSAAKQFVPSAPLTQHELQVREYYERLSRFAAMAWSDCNQATEKLRRLYEETTRLSRAYNAIGLIPYPVPTTTGIMTPSSAMNAVSRDVFNPSSDKLFNGKNDCTQHSFYCACSSCEMARTGSQFKVQQPIYNPPSVPAFAKEPLHGIVTSQPYEDLHKRNNVYNPRKAAGCSGKRRLQDNLYNGPSKMARIDNNTMYKSNDKLVDASRYFHNNSALGSLLNVHEMTPTFNSQYIANGDMFNGSRRSDTSMTSSLCSFDDQRLPCVSSSPSDDIAGMPSMHGFATYSIFPPIGMIRTPVVNLDN